MTEVTASEIGIDPRANYRFYVSEEGIAAPLDRLGSIEYYAGFEYEKEYKTVIGDWVFWSAESSRIMSHLTRLPQFEHLEAPEDY
jgi:hypothetical protein